MLILLQLLDAIEDDVKAGGCIIDWHACDLFPKSWIDLVVVLRVDSSTHYDRLITRYVAHYTALVISFWPWVENYAFTDSVFQKLPRV